MVFLAAGETLDFAGVETFYIEGPGLTDRVR